LFLGSAFAQDAENLPSQPRFVTLPGHGSADKPGVPTTPLTTWNGSFVFGGTTYNYNMAGTAPSTGTSTTVPVYIIPVIIKTKTGTTYDPTKVGLKNRSTFSAVTSTTASPIFNNLTFTQGGTNLGTTQYEDAFQRGNFWGTVSSHTGYHVLLGTPTLLPTMTITGAGSSTQFGVKVATLSINTFDSKAQAYLKAHTQVNPTVLPIFITYDTYLTSGGCCIGGYHSSYASGTTNQAYSHFTYVDKAGAFSQDVSALSHEIGEWLDDPLVVNTGGNTVQCGILEVGDPLEGNTNFGGYPYSLGGFTYNLQDLTFLEYFGAPTTTSVHGWSTFQGETIGTCSNGG